MSQSGAYVRGSGGRGRGNDLPGRGGSLNVLGGGGTGSTSQQTTGLSDFGNVGFGDDRFYDSSSNAGRRGRGQGNVLFGRGGGVTGATPPGTPNSIFGTGFNMGRYQNPHHRTEQQQVTTGHFTGFGSPSVVRQDVSNPITGYGYSTGFGQTSIVRYDNPNPIRGTSFAHGLGIANQYPRGNTRSIGYDRRQSQLSGFSQSAIVPAGRSGSSSSVFQTSLHGGLSPQAYAPSISTFNVVQPSSSIQSFQNPVQLTGPSTSMQPLMPSSSFVGTVGTSKSITASDREDPIGISDSEVKSNLFEVLKGRLVDENVINAIVQEKWCDSHFHLSRILMSYHSAQVDKKPQGMYIPEYFIFDYFRYVNILDIADEYLYGIEYTNLLRQYSNIEFCLARECIGLHPKQVAMSKLVRTEVRELLAFVRHFIGSGYFVGEIGLESTQKMFNLVDQESWIDYFISIGKEFDFYHRIPMQFHIRADDFRYGQTDNEVIVRFFNIIDKLPEGSFVIWHHFSYDWQTLYNFLSRSKNYFVSICGRKEYTMNFIKQDRLSLDVLKSVHGQLLLESDAQNFYELELSIRFGLKNFAEVFFPGFSYADVLKINRENFERAFFYKC